LLPRRLPRGPQGASGLISALQTPWIRWQLTFAFLPPLAAGVHFDLKRGCLEEGSFSRAIPTDTTLV